MCCGVSFRHLSGDCSSSAEDDGQHPDRTVLDTIDGKRRRFVVLMKTSSIKQGE
jgi:hypothetical protein